MPTSTHNHPLFGPVTFKTKHDTWVYGDDITFTSGFDVNDITSVNVPELKNIHGANGGMVKFHKKGQAQLQAAFKELAAQNMLGIVKTFGGSLNFRLRRPISGNLSKLPSDHAFGIAIDLNEDDGSNGGSVAPVAPILKKHGFLWGKSFNDPMHFEIERFLQGFLARFKPGQERWLGLSSAFGLPSLIKNRTFLIMAPEMDKQLFAFKDEHSSNSRQTITLLVILKPRIDIFVAMILAGVFFAFIGFASAVAIGLYAGLIPAVFGALGLAWIVVAAMALARRKHFAITIDSSGITVPTGSVFRPGKRVHVPRDAIAAIGRNESIRGRLISVALRTGGEVPIQARNYCELKAFLAHCKSHGLPTA